jgi:hypothetical protein
MMPEPPGIVSRPLARTLSIGRAFLNARSHRVNSGEEHVEGGRGGAADATQEIMYDAPLVVLRHDYFRFGEDISEKRGVRTTVTRYTR